MGALYKTYHLAEALVEFFDNEIIYDVEDTKDCHTNIHFDAHLDNSNNIIVDVLENTEHYPSQVTDGDNIFNNRFKLTIECIPKPEYKIDNKPNPPMPKDYGELKIVSNPKHIIVNGALYEKIDDSVLTIANRYGDMV